MLDSEISPPNAKRPKKEKDSKFYFENERNSGSQSLSSNVLVDLTVLTFPRVNVPRFKVRGSHSRLVSRLNSATLQLSHLLLKCTIAKASALSIKKRVDIVLGGFEPPGGIGGLI